MPGSVAQVNSAAQNTAATPGTATLPIGATAGNTIVVVYGGDDYVTSGNKPSGFTEPTGARQETFLGHYVWYKTAAGGETSFNFTPNAAATFCWICLELAGVGALDISNGTLIASSGTTMTTPTVTPTAGPRFAVGSIGGSLSSAFNTGMGSWTGGYTEQADIATTLASGTRDNIGVATLSFTADGVTGTSTGITWDGAVTPQTRTGIILVFQDSGATSPDPVWAPHLLVPPGRISPAGRWTPWAGDPSTAVALSAVDANATEAVATGTADNAAASVAPDAAEALAAGSALDAQAAAAANTTEATASGTASAAAASVTVTPAEATAAGTAEWDAGSSISIDLAADNPVEGLGIAYDATVSTNASVSPTATEAVGAGSADNPTPTIGTNALEATAAAAAANPSTTLTSNANPTEATATGTAGDATVSTTSSTNAPATEAIGTGSAGSPNVTIAPAATQPTGAGSAGDASVAAGVSATEATATGAAFNPAIIIGGPGSANAGVAAGSGTAFGARPNSLTGRPFATATARPASPPATARPFATATPRP